MTHDLDTWFGAFGVDVQGERIGKSVMIITTNIQNLYFYKTKNVLMNQCFVKEKKMLAYSGLIQ